MELKRVRQETIIGISVALFIILIISFKAWIAKLARFKMDESAIINSFIEQELANPSLTTKDISGATKLSETRVKAVCDKSEKIGLISEDEDYWQLLSKDINENHK
jgi:hypothetical protein